MSSNINLERMSKTVLSKPDWLLSDLEKTFGITSEELGRDLEILHSKYKAIGINLDFNQLQSNNYLVTYIELIDPILTTLQLGLLTIIALKTKLQTPFLSASAMKSILNNYYKDLQYLVDSNYLEKTNDLTWILTPLGALAILPYIDNSVDLIQNLTAKVQKND